jgi:hypothetical protein
MLSTIKALQRKRRQRRNAKCGLAEIVAAIFVILIIFVAFGVFTVMFNSFASYTKQANQVDLQQAQNAQTSLSLSSFQFGSNNGATSANAHGLSCGTGDTLNSDGSKLVYAGGMWFAFYICSVSGTYTLAFVSSYDGINWGANTTVSALGGSASALSLYLVGNTIYLAASESGNTAFLYATGTLASGGSPTAPLGTFTEASGSPYTFSLGSGSPNRATGPISIEVDSAGNEWVALTVASSSIRVYEHPSASAVNSGWSSNIAPASSPNLGSLSANAVPIILSPPSGISTTGAILVYETGSSTSPSTGQISMITTTTVSATGWTVVIPLGRGSLSDYSLTSSSAVMDGYVLCFAGLASTSVGATTGTLDFWKFQFTSSLTAGIASAETKIESTSASWQAALTVSSSTLVLFDNPSDTRIQSYMSSDIGSTWSVSTTDTTGESAIDGLSPAFGSSAVTWTNSAGLVRFLALSSLTITNNSSFPVELVSLFVSNPATNSLIAIYFKNSSLLYDYWAGAGGTIVTPAYFGYSSSTPYLVTVVTSTGVTVSSTFTSLA